MRAFSASRLFLAGLVAATAAAPMTAAAETVDIAHPGALKAPAPDAAPVTPRGWDPAKKEAIKGPATPGAKAETDLEFLRQRAARLGKKEDSSTWIRVGQLPTSGRRTTDVTMKRGVVGAPRKPNRGQVAMETLVIQHEGMKSPKTPGDALADLPQAPRGRIPPHTPDLVTPRGASPSESAYPRQFESAAKNDPVPSTPPQLKARRGGLR